jgi:hypothetical protein
VLGRSKLILSAARLLAREANRANIPAGGRLEPVPAKGTLGGRRRGSIAGLAVHYGLFLALLGSVLAFFLPAADRLGQGKGALELVVGVVLSLEGVLLVSNWHGARWRLVRRWVERNEARSNRPTGVIDAVRWRLFGYALFLLGIAWVAVGVVELGQGASDLF